MHYILVEWDDPKKGKYTPLDEDSVLDKQMLEDKTKHGLIKWVKPGCPPEAHMGKIIFHAGKLLFMYSCYFIYTITV